MNMDPLPWVRCVQERLDFFSTSVFFSLPIPNVRFGRTQPPSSQCWCVFVWICTSLALKISSVSDASEWELHAACSLVWNHGERRERNRDVGRGRGSGGGSSRERRWGKTALFAQGNLQGQPEHICEVVKCCSVCCGWRNGNVNVSCRRQGGGGWNQDADEKTSHRKLRDVFAYLMLKLSSHDHFEQFSYKQKSSQMPNWLQFLKHDDLLLTHVVFYSLSWIKQAITKHMRRILGLEHVMVIFTIFWTIWLIGSPKRDITPLFNN